MSQKLMRPNGQFNLFLAAFAPIPMAFLWVYANSSIYKDLSVAFGDFLGFYSISFINLLLASWSLQSSIIYWRHRQEGNNIGLRVKAVLFFIVYLVFNLCTLSFFLLIPFLLPLLIICVIWSFYVLRREREENDTRLKGKDVLFLIVSLISVIGTLAFLVFIASLTFAV